MATTFEKIELLQDGLKAAGVAKPEQAAKAILTTIEEENNDHVSRDFLAAQLAKTTWLIISVLGGLITILEFIR